MASSSTDPIKNVHEFDGKWDKKSRIDSKFSKSEKESMFLLLDRLLSCKISGSENPNSVARAGLKLIRDSTGEYANYDRANEIYADDILAELCVILSKIKDDKSKTADLIKNISEQLTDMNNLGQCPQGRTTRLWQLYQSFRV